MTETTHRTQSRPVRILPEQWARVEQAASGTMQNANERLLQLAPWKPSISANCSARMPGLVLRGPLCLLPKCSRVTSSPTDARRRSSKFVTSSRPTWRMRMLRHPRKPQRQNNRVPTARVSLSRQRRSMRRRGPWAGPNLLATIVFENYDAHQPLNRQRERYARESVDLSLSTPADQMGACAVALPSSRDRSRRPTLEGYHRYGPRGLERSEEVWRLLPRDSQ